MTEQSSRIITAQDLESVTISAAQVEAATIISIPFNGRPLVTIRPDGQLEFGPDYTPDDAARAFWDAVQRHTPSPAVQQFGAPLAASIDAELAAGQQAQKQVQRLDQMAAAWSERFPEAISRDTVVEAIHQVTRQDGADRSDSRQAAYDAVFAYIRQQPRDFMPTTVVDRNAMIWHAVHAALDAVGVTGPAEQEG